MIDYTADIREQIAALQERAENSRSCATHIIDLLLDDVFETCSTTKDDSADEFLGSMQDTVVSQAGQAVTSPEYEPPSPEYEPPELEEDNDGGAGWKCKICDAEYSVNFEVYEHLEMEHNIDGDNEEELEANCIKNYVTGEGSADKSETDNSDKSEIKEAVVGDVNVSRDGELSSPSTSISVHTPPIVTQSPPDYKQEAEPEKENVSTP